MSLRNGLVLATVCAASLTTAYRASAQTADSVQNRMTLRLSQTEGLNGGDVIRQTTGWFTWDRIAVGLRQSRIEPFGYGYDTSVVNYALRDQSALIGLALRHNRETLIVGLGPAVVQGDGGHAMERQCGLLGCSAPTPICARAGSLSHDCKVDPTFGYTISVEYGWHFKHVGLGVAYTYLQSSALSYKRLFLGVQLGFMPRPRTPT